MGRNTLPEEGNISMTKSKDWAVTLNNPVVDQDYSDNFESVKFKVVNSESGPAQWK